PGRVYRRDLAADLEALRDGGWRYLALLVEDHELDRWGDADIVERGAAVGVRIERFPMPDGTAPTDASHMDEILAALATARQEGDAAVACMGGVGRTGTVAACTLVAGGWDAEDAIERVRQVRHPTAVETTEQVTFVHRYASNGSSVRR